MANSDGGRNTGKRPHWGAAFSSHTLGRARCSSGAAPFPHGAEEAGLRGEKLNAITTDVTAAAMPWGMSAACAAGAAHHAGKPSSEGERTCLIRIRLPGSGTFRSWPGRFIRGSAGCTREYYGLAGAFLVIGLFFGLAELWAGRMRFVGLSHKERREYADRYKRDNKRPAPFSVLASLDSPGRMVRARRHVWNYAYWLTGAAGLALLGGLVVAVFIESWGETVLRPDLYANADYYLLQPANLFGIASVRGRAGCRDCVGAAAGVPAA